MVTMLKNKCTMCKRNKFLSFWYHCYYFTLSETYFIHLETSFINHASYLHRLALLVLGWLALLSWSHDYRKASALSNADRKESETLGHDQNAQESAQLASDWGSWHSLMRIAPATAKPTHWRSQFYSTGNKHKLRPVIKHHTTKIYGEIKVKLQLITLVWGQMSSPPLAKLSWKRKACGIQ